MTRVDVKNKNDVHPPAAHPRVERVDQRDVVLPSDTKKESSESVETKILEVFDPANKANLVKRFHAFVIDAILATGLAWIPSGGTWIAAAFMLLRDGCSLGILTSGSPGKKVMKLCLVRLDGKKPKLTDSLIRNWIFVPLMLGHTFSIVPLVGVFLSVIITALGILIVMAETAFVIADVEGRRLGDRFSGTLVTARKK